jgi:uncharacterized protein
VSRQPFVVNVGVLRHGGGHGGEHVLSEHRQGALPGAEVTGTRVPAGAEVAIDAVLEWASGRSILVTGTVTAPWEGECRRCLGTARGTLAASVRELYEEEPDPEETYRLKGDQLDLEPLVRDAVLLELPQAPLCAEACAGLCPTCGANRNEGSCTCVTEPTDPRWAALDVLRGGED